MRKRRWTVQQLEKAAKNSFSIRQTLVKLGLRPTGGNYKHIQGIIKMEQIDISHFTGMGWNVGLKFVPKKAIPIAKILKKDTNYQSYKLKRRLFKEGFKKPQCELCGWAEIATDGRIPVELDHINGDRLDNRLENLRVLCPNCHSLQPTHRGLNKVK